MGIILYHYTSTAGAKGIRNEGVIHQSKSSGRFGPGVYLTSLKPDDYYRNEILRNNYGSVLPRYGNHADECVEVDTDNLDKSKLKKESAGSQDIYCYRGSIRVKRGDVKDKPKCKKAQTNSSSGDKLYHYTSTAGARGIRNAELIHKSKSGPNGEGVYLTSLKPQNYYRNEILQNNYGTVPAGFKNRADECVVVDKSKLDPNKLVNLCTGNQDNYLYRDSIRVKRSDVIDKPKHI